VAGEARVVVVTGGSAGIGLAAAIELARRGDQLVLLGRHPGRLAPAVERVREAGGRTPASFQADFAVLDEVRAAGARIGAEFPRIDVLANNAGGLGRWGRTVDGCPQTLQVNHLAGFLLCHLLLPSLRAAAQATGTPARLITTGSIAEVWGWLDVDRPGEPLLRYRSRWLAYGASKQANMLFTVAAARYWGPLGVSPTCFFPGLVRSRFATSSPLFMLGKLIPLLVVSPAKGADTLVWLATDPAGVERPGGNFMLRAPLAASGRGVDPVRAGRLWQASRLAVGLAPDELPVA